MGGAMAGANGSRGVLVRSASQLDARPAEAEAADVETLLRRGQRALCDDGDLRAARAWFQAAHQIAEVSGDAVAAGEAAVGLAGLWADEQRDAAGVALQAGRMRRALARLDAASPVGLRLRLRAAAQADHRAGTCAATMAVAEEVWRGRDPASCAEAAHVVHQCLLGPDHRALRHRLAERLMADGGWYGRHGDVLLGLMWRTVDMFLDGDGGAPASLLELRTLLAQRPHLAIGLVADGIDVMVDIRAGRLDEAETRADEYRWRAGTAGDPDAQARYCAQLVAVRWYRGRIAELAPVLGELVNSPVLGQADVTFLGWLAVAAAAAGDDRQARGVLARLRGKGLDTVPRGGGWLGALHGAVEAAYLLGARVVAAEAYDLLTTYADRPMMVGLGTACFGSVQHALGLAALTMGDTARAASHLDAAVHANLALGHWPAAVLTRVRLAQALDRRGQPADLTEANRHRQLAAQDAAEFGMPWAARATPAPAVNGAETDARAHRRNGQPAICQRRGRHWEITVGRSSVRIGHSRGLQHLAILIANPGQEIQALELAVGPAGGDSPRPELTTRQPILDDVAKRQYRDRLARLQEQIETCESRRDFDRAERFRTERDWIFAELAATAGLAGRSRIFASSEERARIAVGKAIRRTLDHIMRADPAVGDHLRDAIHTGTRCSYRPH